MARARTRGEKIRRFITENVDRHAGDIAKITANKFKISRQAVSKHLRRLVDEKALLREGNTRNRRYTLRSLEEWEGYYNLDGGLAEDVVWRNDTADLLSHLPENVLYIWHYGFTEILNNAIDHANGQHVYVYVQKTAIHTQMLVMDDGIGIFKKIQRELGLLDERHAVLELAKGKLTTDPDNHTGEGIFFASRMFDEFQILSGGVYFSHKFGDQVDWILERSKYESGTAVWMKINNHTARSTRKVFDQYSSEDDIGFSKTIIPVQLTQYGDDKLVSRSQAKRLLARVDRFRTVILDFEGVDLIGQAFADEVFRVFAKRNPELELVFVNANAAVKRMILRAQS
jgi:anti-sigma regulatory factor (Ser/Thr protein kinase)